MILALLMIPVAIGIFFLIIWLFSWLWNITMPQVFGLKSITYWQAFRLMLIAGLLFGSMRGVSNGIARRQVKSTEAIHQTQQR